MLTLAHGEMETLRILPPSYAVRLYCIWYYLASGTHRSSLVIQEVDALARDWVQPPPGAAFALRIPVEFLPWQAAVCTKLAISSHNLLIHSTAHGPIAICLGSSPRIIIATFAILTSLQLTSEETYLLATSGNNPMRIEIVSEAPPPPEMP